jgi:hypothetical protein
LKTEARALLPLHRIPHIEQNLEVELLAAVGEVELRELSRAGGRLVGAGDGSRNSFFAAPSISRRGLKGSIIVIQSTTGRRT